MLVTNNTMDELDILSISVSDFLAGLREVENSDQSNESSQGKIILLERSTALDSDSDDSDSCMDFPISNAAEFNNMRSKYRKMWAKEFGDEDVLDFPDFASVESNPASRPTHMLLSPIAQSPSSPESSRSPTAVSTSPSPSPAQEMSLPPQISCPLSPLKLLPPNTSFILEQTEMRKIDRILILSALQEKEVQSIESEIMTSIDHAIVTERTRLNFEVSQLLQIDKILTHVKSLLKQEQRKMTKIDFDCKFERTRCQFETRCMESSLRRATADRLAENKRREKEFLLFFETDRVSLAFREIQKVEMRNRMAGLIQLRIRSNLATRDFNHEIGRMISAQSLIRRILKHDAYQRDRISILVKLQAWYRMIRMRLRFKKISQARLQQLPESIDTDFLHEIDLENLFTEIDFAEEEKTNKSPETIDAVLPEKETTPAVEEGTVTLTPLAATNPETQENRTWEFKSEATRKAYEAARRHLGKPKRAK
jgi:hypothetical protein